LIFSALLILFSANVFGQSGGTYAITESVVAGGGQASTGGTFSLDGTVGQTAAGNRIGNAPFAVTSGFWNFAALAPTVASVAVGGRVLTADGRGIRNVRIRLTDATGETRMTLSSSFGYFRFEDVAVGETYVFSVKSKVFVFSSPTQVHSISGDTNDINFVAD